MAEPQNAPDDMPRRLRDYTNTKSGCEAAIRGEAIPHALAQPLVRRCLIRGIRYNDGFGQELFGVLPMFTRALNAQSILNDRIPEMSSEAGGEDVPYCIWHPKTASEDTYRELVRRYPYMVYQVARACAVAGYTELYRNLDILPEVSIAEEARDCGSMDIYDDIVSQYVRYNVMDDYTRSIAAEPKPGAYLNGDTAVRSSLEEKQKFSHADTPYDDDDDEHDSEPFWLFSHPGFEDNTFDITEDMNIDIVYDPWLLEGRRLFDTTRFDVKPLLISPLPADLPTVDKDLLILMAAYYGDIDRYVRLRRPVKIEGEIYCCVRGVYHNTMFALWWASQEEQPETARNVPCRVKTAITARMIMNNVLLRVKEYDYKRHSDLPYLIWYPSIARESTYRELFRLQPSMAPQILRACVAGGYTELFDEVLATIEPDAALVEETDAECAGSRSTMHSGKHFREAVERRILELGGQIKPIKPYESWPMDSTQSLQVVSNHVPRGLAEAGVYGWESLYDGAQCDASSVEVMASMPEEWMKIRPDYGAWEAYDVDYVEWPSKETEDEEKETGDQQSSLFLRSKL